MVDISIIIPTYNRLWCLPQAVDSCRHSKFITEIIVVDDGSDDGTSDWLKSQHDLKVISRQRWGKCRAVNEAFHNATGKYIRFLDSDDLLDITANDEQFAIAQHTNADLVVSGYKVFTDEQTILKTQPWVACDDFIAQQLGECDASHYSAYLFKKQFIRDIPHRPEFSFRDDRLFVLEVALKDPVISLHRGTALLHRSHRRGRLQENSGLKQEVQNYQHLLIYKHILHRLGAEQRLTGRRIDASLKILWPLCNWIAQTHLQDAEKVYEWITLLKPDFEVSAKGLSGFLFRNTGFSFTQKLLRIIRFIKYGWR
jgi:glycosyltransferase involved in cell wall biosynthesis